MICWQRQQSVCVRVCEKASVTAEYEYSNINLLFYLRFSLMFSILHYIPAKYFPVLFFFPICALIDYLCGKMILGFELSSRDKRRNAVLVSTIPVLSAGFHPK